MLDLRGSRLVFEPVMWGVLYSVVLASVSWVVLGRKEFVVRFVFG